MGAPSHDTHLVYLLSVGGGPYMGRTKCIRITGANAIHGITARWSEHAREFQHHADGKTKYDRKRRRYIELINKHSTNCSNVVIIEECDSASIPAREALSIALVNPHANGAEHKHLAESLRPPRPHRGSTQASPPRKRPHQSTRTRARKSQLKFKDALWGGEQDSHASGLHGRSKANIEEAYEKHCRKKLNIRQSQSYLVLSFGEL